LAIIYAVLGMSYATSSYYISVTANYIYEYLTPLINSKLNTSGGKVFQGEHFLREERRNFLPLILSLVGPGAESFIIVIPSLISLIAAQYMQFQSSQLSVSNNAVSILLITIRILGWLFLFATISSQVLATLFASKTGYISKR
jgi:hypothetical protein